MALAIRFDELIRDSDVADQAELARVEHVSRARFTQIMNLLNLAPDIQKANLFLPRVQHGRDPVSQRDLRAVLGVLDLGGAAEDVDPLVRVVQRIEPKILAYWITVESLPSCGPLTMHTPHTPSVALNRRQTCIVSLVCGLSDVPETLEAILAGPRDGFLTHSMECRERGAGLFKRHWSSLRELGRESNARDVCQEGNVRI